MNHEDAREQLSAYLDGELDAAARGALEARLAEDAELRAELDGLRRTVELVQSLPQRPAPAGFADRVVAVLENSAPRPHGWVRRWGPVVLAAAACLVIGLLATLAPGRQDVRSGARLAEPAGEKAPASVVRERDALDRTPAVAGKVFAADAPARGAVRHDAAALAVQSRAGGSASVENQALLDDIRRVSKARARVEYKRQNADGPRNGPVVRVTTQYDTLEPCLREIRAALERQQATYVVQPVGSGQFTIEVSLPEGSARAIVAALRLRGERRQRLAKAEGLKTEPPAGPAEEPTAPLEQAKAGADAPGRLVHLVLHFEPRGTAAGAPAKP
jgi:hypothetical protein